MSYSDKFDRSIEVDVTEAQALVVRSIMKEGELKFRENLIKSLESDLSEYLEDIDYEPNIAWMDGVRYVIHILREADLDESGK